MYRQSYLVTILYKMIPNANGWLCRKRNALRLQQIIFIYAVTFLVEVAAVSDEICKTTACKETAAAILNNMDTNVKPCDDFYEFACGNFMRHNEGDVNYDTENNAIVYDRLKPLLEQPITPNDIRPFVLAKKYYQSCMNYDEEYTNSTICVILVTIQLDIAATALYARTYITADVKKSIDDIAKHLRSEFVKVVKQIKWMDNITKAYALEKVNEIKETVGYPKEFFDDAALVNFYSTLTFPNDSFRGITLAAKSFYSKFQHHAEYAVNAGKYEWYIIMAGSRSSAFYIPENNRIVIPPPTLTGRVFNPNWPAYRNYGSLGMIVGHELTHSVDVTGKHYDQNGKKSNWWSPHSNNIYNEKAQCVIDQYNEYIDPDSRLHVNGSRTLGENIADNIGVTLAYYAYQQAIKDQNPPQSLPGLEKFDSNQMFWISAANVRCGTHSKQGLNLSMTIDVHSILRFRVNGAFSNNDEFNQAFNCPKTSAMNRVHKCDV